MDVCRKNFEDSPPPSVICWKICWRDAWIHPKRASGLYQNGVTKTLIGDQILLSAWSNSPATVALWTNLSILDTINGSNTPIPVAVIADKVTGPSVTRHHQPQNRPQWSPSAAEPLR